MKYGKEFQQILNDSDFPEEWKASAIEYGQLKKLIKNVVAELSNMGLSPDVLHKLLVTDASTGTSTSQQPNGSTLFQMPTSQAGPSSSSRGAIQNGPSPAEREREDVGSSADKEEDDEEGDVLEFEFESDESPPTLLRPESNGASTSRAKEVILDPILDDELDSGSGWQHDDRHRQRHPSSYTDTDRQQSSSLRSEAPHHRKFRLRLLSDNQPRASTSVEEEIRPMSVSEMMMQQGAGGVQRSKSPSPETLTRLASQEEQEDHHHPRRVKRAVIGGSGGAGAKAEYVLVGEASHPVPQLRLHLSLLPPIATGSENTSPVNGVDEPETTDDEDEELDDEDDIVPASSSSLRTPTARSPLIPSVDVIPPSPSLSRMRTAMSPIWALVGDNDLESGMKDLGLVEPALPASLPTPIPSSIVNANTSLESINEPIPEISSNGSKLSTTPEREFIIPLASDMAFFSLLTAALTSLSAFHTAQQAAFQQAVLDLCSAISRSIQPSSDSIQVLSTPLTPTPRMSDGSAPSSSALSSRVSPASTKASKKDLYAWREIFTLWIESEIFESSAERTRGERTVEQAEVRLKKFANEVVKRGLGDRRTLRGKRARGAWEEFLRLNVLLLDLKRFQMANINAARKILKKHDKRTALTASAGFPSFVRSTLSAHVDADGNVSTWTFVNTSLPHILLTSLTDTLLPILPSLDDYACLICTSIAFKPIRLNCGHLFCVRCLVKMQRAGKAECPLCRSKVVLLADKASLDLTVMNFMREWFPKEVKAKQRENEDEIAREQVTNTGMDPRCIIM